MKDLLKNNWFIILIAVIFIMPIVIDTKKNVSEPSGSVKSHTIAQPKVVRQDKKQPVVSGNSSNGIQQPKVLVRSDLSKTNELEANEALQQCVVQNKCVKKNFGYKHWTGTYYPSKFVLKFDNVVVLTFDGKEFQYPNNKIVINQDRILKTRFDWEFLGGRRSGWKEIEFKINENADKLDINFDWKSEQKDSKNDPWQLTISQAKPIKQRAAENK
jgi:hypothetical protein